MHGKDSSEVLEVLQQCQKGHPFPTNPGDLTDRIIEAVQMCAAALRKVPNTVPGDGNLERNQGLKYARMVLWNYEEGLLNFQYVMRCKKEQKQLELSKER